MEMVSFISLLDKLQHDFKIGTAHISLMTALIRFNEKQQNNNIVFVKGSEVRKFAKINSRSSYHKYLRELQSFGYIGYEPCFNHNKYSRIEILTRA